MKYFYVLSQIVTDGKREVGKKKFPPDHKSQTPERKERHRLLFSGKDSDKVSLENYKVKVLHIIHARSRGSTKFSSI